MSIYEGPTGAPPPEPTPAADDDRIHESFAPDDPADETPAEPIETPPPLPKPPGPTAERERIEALDVLRGVAVFGILFVNIEDFGLVRDARYDPTVSGGDTGLDYAAWLFTLVFTDTKFIAIFTMLFGAGIALLAERRRRAGLGRHLALYYRRMGFLLVLGLLHFTLLWDGDILYYYAFWGLILYPFPYLPGFLLFAIGAILLVIHGNLMGEIPLDRVGAYWPRFVDMMRGSWSEQYEWRELTFRFMHVDMPIEFGYHTVGWMCIGMAALKLGFLRAAWRKWVYAIIAICTFPVGLLLVSLALGWHPPYEEFGIQTGFYYGSMLLTLAYSAAVVLGTLLLPRLFLTRALAAAGRMALTNYLLQTIICTTIFYGYGFGQFERFDRFELLLTVLGICGFELILSSIWFRFFLFGPMEWLWRSFTYLKFQPLLRQAPVRVVATPTMDRFE